MLYFHSFWTRPFFENQRDQFSHEIEIWEYEALTWLLSALEIRRHSPLRLITDSRGLRFVQNTGLEWVYNAGITTELDQIPEVIQPHLFWAAGKVWSWQVLNEPAVSVDTDAVLWGAVSPAADVMGLHLENNQWPWYAANKADLERFGFTGPEWNWALHPLNQGVLMIRSRELMRLYARTATEFMSRYSAFYMEQINKGQPPPPRHGDAVLFAEQRLLVMCAHQLCLSVAPITQLDTNAAHLVRDRHCTHLWLTKEYYRYCAEARIGLCNYLINRLLSDHPESRRTLEKWKLGGPMPRAPKMQLDFRELPVTDERRARLSLITQVNGVVWILDPNIEARRQASPGSLVLPGERIVPEDGATFATCSANADGI